MSSRSAEAGVAFAHSPCETPVGTLTLVADDAALIAVLWPQDDPARVPLPATAAADAHPVLIEAARQIDAYFARALTRFTVPLRFIGTDFQRAVWQALLTIPYGETRSYGAIARQIGRPAAIRAVGAANGRNPISILAPCHRVVGTGGALTGFAGGLAVKRRLLELESPTLFA
jgi:methylated-DNA-[protein]-cysteine S-methyltransferase